MTKGFKRVSGAVLVNGLLVVLCICLFVCNLILLRANRSLHSAIASLTLPTVGMSVPSLISGFDLNGKPAALAQQPGKQRLLLVYSPVCPFCKANWPKWYRLFKTLDSSRVDIQLIDLTSLSNSAFIHDHHADRFPVLHGVDPSVVNSLRLTKTPETILVGPDYRVARVWVGVLSDQNTNELIGLVGREWNATS